ncbi:hypothetical protein DFH06DRAFT_1292941 [Mycena polygramma]|nr:hypothetical protein DFH06DRAFT_1292941 [Mycena polygramma]
MWDGGQAIPILRRRSREEAIHPHTPRAEMSPGCRLGARKDALIVRHAPDPLAARPFRRRVREGEREGHWVTQSGAHANERAAARPRLEARTRAHRAGSLKAGVTGRRARGTARARRGARESRQEERGECKAMRLRTGEDDDRQRPAVARRWGQRQADKARDEDSATYTRDQRGQRRSRCCWYATRGSGAQRYRGSCLRGIERPYAARGSPEGNLRVRNKVLSAGHSKTPVIATSTFPPMSGMRSGGHTGECLTMKKRGAGRRGYEERWATWSVSVRMVGERVAGNVHGDVEGYALGRGEHSEEARQGPAVQIISVRQKESMRATERRREELRNTVPPFGSGVLRADIVDREDLSSACMPAASHSLLLCENDEGSWIRRVEENEHRRRNTGVLAAASDDRAVRESPPPVGYAVGSGIGRKLLLTADCRARRHGPPLPIAERYDKHNGASPTKRAARGWEARAAEKKRERSAQKERKLPEHRRWRWALLAVRGSGRERESESDDVGATRCAGDGRTQAPRDADECHCGRRVAHRRWRRCQGNGAPPAESHLRDLHFWHFWLQTLDFRGYRSEQGALPSALTTALLNGIPPRKCGCTGDRHKGCGQPARDECSPRYNRRMTTTRRRCRPRYLHAGERDGDVIETWKDTPRKRSAVTQWRGTLTGMMLRIAAPTAQGNGSKAREATVAPGISGDSGATRYRLRGAGAGASGQCDERNWQREIWMHCQLWRGVGITLYTHRTSRSNYTSSRTVVTGSQFEGVSCNDASVMGQQRQSLGSLFGGRRRSEDGRLARTIYWDFQSEALTTIPDKLSALARKRTKTGDVLAIGSVPGAIAKLIIVFVRGDAKHLLLLPFIMIPPLNIFPVDPMNATVFVISTDEGLDRPAFWKHQNRLRRRLPHWQARERWLGSAI